MVGLFVNFGSLDGKYVNRTIVENDKVQLTLFKKLILIIFFQKKNITRRKTKQNKKKRKKRKSARERERERVKLYLNKCLVLRH